MPKTPPLTPFTPTTDTSLSSGNSAFSVTFFTNIFVHMRVTSRQPRALLVLLAGLFFILLLLVVFGVAGVKTGTVQMLQYIWRVLITLSETIETGIEGVGWMLGRAVGRFGNGFARGYHV